MRDPGHRPEPFRDFVLKIHGRCDLACDHCFVYTEPDQLWRHRPSSMSGPVVRRTAARIAEHAATHRLDVVSVVLHGGEPLLAGADRIAACAAEVRRAVDPATSVRLGIQTNGLRLTPEVLDVLRGWEIRVGVSLDGDRRGNDRHRRFRDGTSSYDAVAAALRLLARPENRAIYAGVLCTVDLANDPVRTYESLLEFAPPQVDFLLPVANWSRPPPGGGSGSATPYADWLTAVFDRWYGAPVRETGVRWFEDVLGLLLGGGARAEGVGTAPSSSIVVETDGSITACDALTAAYEGAGRTGLSVRDHTFDEALADPRVVERQGGLRALGPACRACRLRDVCGGGGYAQRYRAGAGFRNPSVYCDDLFATITHVRAALAADLAAAGLPVRR